MFPVLDQDGWMHGPMEEALFISDRIASNVAHSESNRLSSMGSMGLSLIQEETFMRTSTISSNSKPFGELGLKNARDPLLRHSAEISFGHCTLPPYTSPPSLTVPNASRSQNLPYESEQFVRFPSMPARSRSEKIIPKKQELRPRAQTGDKTTLSNSRSVSSHKYESVPLNIDSVHVEVLTPQPSSEINKERKSSSRDSIQLLVSPIVKLRTSSDEDSAILSDNCDSQSSDNAQVAVAAINAGSSQNGTVDSLGAEDATNKHIFTAHNNSNKDVVSFKIGSGGSSLLSNKDSSSSDSSNRSKSRGSSFNTTDTSGVGSCESNPTPAPCCNISSALTPIPSSSSLSTLVPPSTLVEQPQKESVHPSVLQRSLFKLSRIPSAKRRSASPALGIANNGGQTFTSQRDVLGYAALRNIKRQRTYSSEVDGETLNHLEAPTLHRTISQDSELSVESNMWLR